MSKTKTKRARREAKREESRKIAAHHRKAASTPKHTSAPLAKNQKSQKQQNPQPQPQPAATPSKPRIQASQKHDIPFGLYDKILLVGEGDFSFTRSLVIEHGCASVTATSYDSEEDVRTKYPGFEAAHAELTALTPPVPFMHAIDATKLGRYKKLRVDAPWDTIAFMFPHTGGLSTDVNRQVRANQSLLVSFFRSCLDLPPSTASSSSAPPKKSQTPLLKNGGRVIVTLFEGEPYTLWNVRDLARHAGLAVVESFRFVWEDYPGYKHVRTLGALEGGWKGEDRAARMYVFEKRGGDEGQGGGRKEKNSGGKKRRKEESDSESDEG